MLKLCFSYLTDGGDRCKYAVIRMDSAVEWDAEEQGREPHYGSFVEFLGSVIFELAQGERILAAFTERIGLVERTRSIRVDSAKHFDKLFVPEARSNEWLFFYVGNEGSPEWLEYRPSFVLDEAEKLEYGELVKEAEFICYHESALNYAEIQVDYLKKDEVVEKLKQIAAGKNIVCSF